jgi:hypothetical protein
MSASDSSASLVFPLEYQPDEDDWNQWMQTLSQTLAGFNQATNGLPMTGPAVGQLATQSGAFSGLGNFADDAAAEAGGVPVGGLYRNGNLVLVRLDDDDTAQQGLWQGG